MKLNVNKNIISGNNLLPFYFLPQLLISKRNTIRLVFQSRSLFLNELPEVLFVKRKQRAVLVCERALPPVAEHDIKLNLLHH